MAAPTPPAKPPTLPSPIDLRSDTVTRPTAAMRRAMAEAEVGDDVYGEDPTVRRLEEAAAERLGKAAAIFVPSGTMANQIAIRLLAAPGTEAIMEAAGHPFHFEAGALALAGVQARLVQGERGVFGPADVAALVRPGDDHFPRTRLVVVENTHNMSGGTVWPLEAMAAVAEAARANGLAVHLDGARLLNAEVAAGVPAARWAGHADTVSLCFSKGLGAPVGSILASSAERVHAARRIRRQLGGAMRQAGVLAAAALHALEHHVDRLANDHAAARALADALADHPHLDVDPARVETNIVRVGVRHPSADANALAARMAEGGALASAIGPDALRFVTHLDVPQTRIAEAAARIREAAD